MIKYEPDVKIESIVLRSEIRRGVPKDNGSGFIKRDLIAPWEFCLRKIHGDFYDGDWQPRHCCPRCLSSYTLPHGVEIITDKHSIETELDRDADVEDAQYFYTSNNIVEEIVDADNPVVTVNPSVGCPTCGFHCMLEENEYNILSDWAGASGNPDKGYKRKMEGFQYGRPDVYDRLISMGYPEPE